MKLNESRPKNIDTAKQIQKLIGRKPISTKGRISNIYKMVKIYGIDSKLYTDDHWQAMSDYKKAIESLGCQFECWCEGGGYTDRDPNDGMPRSKEYKLMITYDDGMIIGGYIKLMAAGTVEDPFSRYDTCIILWPK